jgi:GNAT superfamily N-acetyltransferase
MNALTLRRLRPEDSIDELTALLHRSFARLGADGLCCRGVYQSAMVTRHRIALGDCLVAVVDSRIVGTVTLQAPSPHAAIDWYRHSSVASLHQFAVDPTHQGIGIGRALLRAAERWAFVERCATLALDTPEPAQRLRAYYGRQGFSLLSTVQVEGRGYRSAVLSKAVRLAPRSASQDDWPARHPAEMALMAKQAREHAAQSQPSRHGPQDDFLVRKARSFMPAFRAAA